MLASLLASFLLACSLAFSRVRSLAGSRAGLNFSLKCLFSLDVERDGDWHNDHDGASENKQGLAARPEGSDIVPLDIVPVCKSLGRLQVQKGGEDEAREGHCDPSRDV